jgi:hypothetical protein
MKLLLSTEEVAAHARAAGTSTTSVADDTRRALTVLRDAKHDPVTRADVKAVLVGMGWDGDQLQTNPYWSDVGGVLSALRLVRRGFYSLFTEGETPVLDAALDRLAQQAADVQSKRRPRDWRAPTATEPTLTAQWFEAQIRDNALNRKVAALLHRKYPFERFDELLSEVGLWFVQWGNAGTCDQFIKDGKPPSVTILTIWMEGKFTQGLYKRGQDALTRETMGARTQGEVRVMRETKTSYIRPDAACGDPSAPETVMVGDEEEGTRRREFVAPEAVSELFDEVQLGLVRDLVEVTHARAADRYGRYFDHLIHGRTPQEVAALEGDSALRVSKISQRVRKDLEDAPVMLQIAMRVLQAISEEPFSEVDEVVEVFPRTEKTVGRSDVSLALDFLVKRNLAFEEKGTFCPTPKGHATAEAGSFV